MNVSSILSLMVISLPLINCHNVHKHFNKNEKTTVSQFENHQDHVKFDHEALFGSSNEELGQLTPDEAKKRLREFILNGKMDSDSDGFISKDELSNWVLNSFQSINKQDALDQLKEEDENNDGKISWDEHYKNNFNLGTEQNLDEKEMIYEDKELFATADLNEDGFLDKDEFALFISPEDYPVMFDTLYKLTMRRRDINGDGLLSFDEFIVNERGVMPDTSSDGYLIDKDKFKNDLDKNKDGFLQKDEVLNWIIPTFSMEEAEHLINSCDDNKDGKLTLDEIVNNYDVFLESETTEFGDRLKDKHDEL